MTEIFTAKTVEEAKAMAVKKFGKRASDIKFEIIDEGKKGFFGIGKTDATVKATYDEPVKGKPAAAVKTPAVEKAAKAEEKTALEKAAEADITPEAEEKKPVVEEAAKVEDKLIVEEAAKVVENPAAEETPKIEEKTETKEISETEDDSEEEEKYELIEDESKIEPKVKIARDYIKSILNAMEIDVNFSVYQNEKGAIINIESDNNGTIIGRRGETLDSIQYLCSIIANKGDKDYFRITIDCLGYRSKRKETLQQLAVKVAKSVLRSGRSQQLEPMNPYERRVIHSAISEIEGVSSRSVGEEPYRKIIISSNNPKNNGRRRPNGRRDDRKGGDRNRRPRANRETFEPKAIDLSTSFEKDYKKPKPEDSMEGGLYGKIEF